MHVAVQEVRDQGGLTYYASIADRPGFLQTLQECFVELKRARVTPEALLEYASEHSRGLVELARLYAAYQSRLRALGWADPEGLNWLAVSVKFRPKWATRFQPKWSKHRMTVDENSCSRVVNVPTVL